jgi:hypothetical protein
VDIREERLAVRLDPTGPQPLSVSTVMSWPQSWIGFILESVSALFSFFQQQNWVRLVFLIFGFRRRFLTSTPQLL